VAYQGKIGAPTSMPTLVKRVMELVYWFSRRISERTLSNDHYVHFYTNHFGLTRSDYRDKRVLDIGCGPRGSLEWADMAAERVGLDPLVNQYRALGAHTHRMRYVAAGAESIPFPDGHFDIVCSFNSLDHVDDLDRVVSEICRTVKPGGLFLLISELNHAPTLTEPLTFSWDVVERFSPPLDVLETARYEKSENGTYQSIRRGIVYDDTDARLRYGIISAKFRKPVQ
jgi:ubiquinone/menaquinone biosynthesis C-methylase UbiE